MIFRILNKIVYWLFKLPILPKHKQYYKKIGFNELFPNWLHQRVLGVNVDVPISVKFTTRLRGFNNIVIIGNPEKIYRCFAEQGCCYFGIANGTTLTIGEGTIWAYGFTVVTSNHKPFDLDAALLASVTIGSNCWFGAKVTITPGVTIGNNVIVGANSVVTKSFGNNVVLGGVPAKIIKHL